MPPKKRNRPSIKKKKVQIIRTRLIEISLKVEDLIYHKKPISEAEAEMFINEVTSYQIECSQDERSLQVIEKLMRCMKAIIAERQEGRLDDDNTECEGYHLCNGSASPVYSLPDADRTQMTQQLQVQASVNFVREEDVTNMEDCCNNHLNETDFHQDTQIYDLVSSDNEIDKNSFTVPSASTKNMRTINVEIHKALSNLSLKDVDQDKSMSTDIESSQSILKGFHELDNLDPNCTLNLESRNGKNICDDLKITEARDQQTESQDLVTELPPSLVTIHPPSPIITEEVNKNLNITKQPMRTNSNVNNSFNYVRPGDDFNVISVQNFAHNGLSAKISTKALKDDVFKSIPVIFNKKIESKNINVTEAHPFEGNHDITNLGSNLKTKLQENITNTNPVITLKKKRNPRKKKVTGNKEEKDNIISKTLVTKSNDTEKKKIIKPTKRRTNSRKNNQTEEKDSSLAIYNKNVENDLSWLEGIRFVREIGEDEYDSKLTNLNEDFWDNYYLPPNFDDGDFL
ncbi:unnamed protein product [Arctia plantaginis]|uniref:Uncharacterized protein n=1 Tax=Arctia plantaginis TaxID=874455 RepID=A0A8S1A3J9_ARCPL|nr:unnamed protein product [Arctia plantaginis]